MRAAAARAASRRGASTRNLLSCRPGFAREHERHPRGLAGARRRDQNRDVPRAQSAVSSGSAASIGSDCAKLAHQALC
jgi:hypothetical protein